MCTTTAERKVFPSARTSITLTALGPVVVLVAVRVRHAHGVAGPDDEVGRDVVVVDARSIRVDACKPRSAAYVVVVGPVVGPVGWDTCTLAALFVEKTDKGNK